MNKNYEIANRLRQFFESKYSSNAAFARALGISPQNLNKYIRKENPIPLGPSMRERLILLGCDIEWLISGKPSLENEIGQPIPLTNIPVYSHVNAGEKKWVVSEEIVDYIAIPKSSDKTLFGVIVKGNSMHDEISDGDIVVLSAKAEIKNGDLCVVEWEDGDRHLRRVTFDKHNIILTSKNEHQYPPIITHKNKIRKLYRVMKHIRNY